jgi:serine phosphatase RsbU (regulator of sigma subunit)
MPYILDRGMAANEGGEGGGQARSGAAGVDARPAQRARQLPSRLAVAVLVAILAVTAAFAVAAHDIYDHNETHLLDLRVRELGLVLAAAVETTQTPVSSAAALAGATNGNPRQFRLFAAPQVGADRAFASLSLWSLHGSRVAPTVVVGPAPLIESQPGRARSLLATLARNPTRLVVVNELNSRTPMIAYAIASEPGGWVAYAERPLPADRHSRLQANSAFDDLNYAFYLGARERPADLLVTDVPALPLRGRRATDAVPFGDSDLTVVVTARGSLGGTFFEELPWLVVAIGAVVALAAALLTDRLVRRRRRAEDLARSLDLAAEENRRLYAEQRSIAQTLQHALLPEALPAVDGLETSIRYLPGISGIDVGGDWYDLVALDAATVVAIVGDVSGRGLRAAATMASLRNATIAYAMEGDGPGTILGKLDRLVRSTPHDYFATILCVRIATDARRLTLASAGHYPPLLLDAEGARFAPLRVGAPVGAGDGAPYEEVTVTVGTRATIIAYTDGLIERRNEVVDIGLARLRDSAAAAVGSLDELVSRLIADLRHDDGDDDDTAVLGVRWRD